MVSIEHEHPAAGLRLLELLRFAGWRLEHSSGAEETLTAIRDGVEVRVSARTFAEAAAEVFIGAMRSASGAAPAEPSSIAA